MLIKYKTFLELLEKNGWYCMERLGGLSTWFNVRNGKFLCVEKSKGGCVAVARIINKFPY